MRRLFSFIKFFLRLILAALLIFFTIGSLVVFVKVRGNVSFGALFAHLFLLLDGFMRFSLPDKLYPLGFFISYVYCKAVFIFFNVILSSFEIELYDVTTSYCFNLLLVYQDTNLFIILILSFVYYCLYKIIEEHLYNLYGDKVSVYPYLYGRFRRYCIKFYDFGCSLLEELNKFHLREIVLYFKKFFPVSLFYLFDAFNIYKSSSRTSKFKNFGKFERFLHVYGLWYLKIFTAFCSGRSKGGECFSYARAKKTLNKNLDSKFVSFFDDKIFKNISLQQYEQIQNDLISGENAPFANQKMYYVGKISKAHVLYQLFLMSDNKNVYSYDLSSDSVGAFKIFDDSFLHVNAYNFKNLSNICLYGYTKSAEILYNNLLIASSESNAAKNAIDFDEVLDDTPERYKSHHVNSFIYLYNRSGKYLSSGVPLNNNFSSHRFIQAMSLDVRNTFSFYEVFSIFLSNVFVKSEDAKNLGDSSTYVMLSEPYIISFLSKLGSYNHCQHSLENGPWYDVVLKAHELVHSFAFEYAWAIFPSSIICYLMVPAYLLLYSLEFFGQAFLMIKIIAHQWFWSYEIENSVNNSSSVKFDSNLATNEEYNKCVEAALALPQTGYYRSSDSITPRMATKFAEKPAAFADIHTSILNLTLQASENFLKGSISNIWKEGGIKEAFKGFTFMKENGAVDTFSVPRLLSTDARLILPAEKPILLSISSTDVLHAFAVPNFGLKVDAVPGRINTFWLYMNKAGIYYGQCSELCGKGHGFMPIVVDSQHYSNNPFINEILRKESDFFPVALAENPEDWEGPGIDGYDHIRDHKIYFFGPGDSDLFHDFVAKDIFADKGHGYHFGDGPDYVLPQKNFMDTGTYHFWMNDWILERFNELYKKYGHLRIEIPFAVVPFYDQNGVLPLPFKSFPATELLSREINRYIWECQSDPDDWWSVRSCKGYVWYEKFLSFLNGDGIFENKLYSWAATGTYLMEPIVLGYPPLDIASVAKTNMGIFQDLMERHKGYIDKSINWSKPYAVDPELYARKEWAGDRFFIYMQYAEEPFLKCLVNDPVNLYLNDYGKLFAQTPEDFGNACGRIDFNRERARQWIQEAREWLLKAEEALIEAENMLENDPKSLPTDSHSHRYQVKNLKEGNWRECFKETRTMLDKHEQLLNHVEYQEKTYFRNFELLKKTWALRYYYM